MAVIRHKFQDEPILGDIETLIIGTFNPDFNGNKAEFFYGRSRNYLWKILSLAFNEPDLKIASVNEKKEFIKRRKIGFIDLISEITVEEGQELNYSDTYLDSRVKTWNKILPEIDKLSSLKRVGFTRKTFTGIPEMQKRIATIGEYCMAKNIYFTPLVTPARFYNGDKQEEWNCFLSHD